MCKKASEHLNHINRMTEEWSQTSSAKRTDSQIVTWGSLQRVLMLQYPTSQQKWRSLKRKVFIHLYKPSLPAHRYQYWAPSIRLYININAQGASVLFSAECVSQVFFSQPSTRMLDSWYEVFALLFYFWNFQTLLPHISLFFKVTLCLNFFFLILSKRYCCKSPVASTTMVTVPYFLSRPSVGGPSKTDFFSLYFQHLAQKPRFASESYWNLTGMLPERTYFSSRNNVIFTAAMFWNSLLTRLVSGSNCFTKIRLRICAGSINLGFQRAFPF